MQEEPRRVDIAPLERGGRALDEISLRRRRRVRRRPQPVPGPHLALFLACADTRSTSTDRERLGAYEHLGVRPIEIVQPPVELDRREALTPRTSNAMS